MFTPAQERLERALSSATGSLVRAASEAETLSDQGLSEDLYQLAGEVARLLNLSASGKRPRLSTNPSVRICKLF